MNPMSLQNRPADTDNPIFDAVDHVAANWQDYVEALTSPEALYGLGGLGLLSAAGLYGTRKAGHLVAQRPGDVEIGRSMTGPKDFVFGGRRMMRWVDRTYGTELVGPTGAGKTTALLPLVAQDLAWRHNVVIVEMFGDLGTRSIRYAVEMGRPAMVFDTSVDGTLKLNPLGGPDDEDVIERFVSSVRGVFTHHFYGPFQGDATRSFARLAREYARLRGGEADLALFELLLTDADFLEKVLAVKQEGQGPNARRRVGAPWVGRQTRTWFDSEYLKWSEKMRTEGLAGLKDFIRGLMATAAARKALCPGPGDLTLDLRAALSMGGVLVVIRIPRTSVGAEPAYAITRHAVKMLQDFSLERSDLYDALWPCALYLDELPTLIGRSVDDAMAVAGWMALLRKNGFALTSAYQGTALLSDVVQGTLDSNARNKLFAGGLGADDARKVQSTLGRVETVVEDERVSRGAPLSPRPSTYSRGKRTQERPRYAEEELRYLPLGTWLFSGLKDRSPAPPVRLRIPPVGAPAYYRRLAAARDRRLIDHGGRAA